MSDPDEVTHLPYDNGPDLYPINRGEAFIDCPQCGSTLIVEEYRDGEHLRCSNEDCNWTYSPKQSTITGEQDPTTPQEFLAQRYTQEFPYPFTPLDLHKLTAARMYETSYSKVTEGQRRTAKLFNLASAYRMDPNTSVKVWLDTLRRN